MSDSHQPRIHPTAVISPLAEIAADVQIGPYVVIEDHVRIGAGCILRPFVHLAGPMTLGKGNILYSGAVLGEKPQHLKYNDEPTHLEIGDDNVFREHVTVHRGTSASNVTRIGSRNYFMAHSHIAHDCRVGNGCIFANGALLAGHCTIGDNVFLSGNCAIHQFVRVGRLALLSGTSATTKDIPPFIIQQGINCVVGLNVVGMRRAGITNEEINALRQVFHILYRSGQPLSHALAQADQELGTVAVVAEMLQFIRESTRGINLGREKDRASAA